MLCQQYELCPPPKHAGYYAVSSWREKVTEDTLDQIELPDGFNTWKDCCLNRYKKATTCCVCKRAHKGTKLRYHPQEWDWKKKIWPCCGWKTPQDQVANITQTNFVSALWGAFAEQTPAADFYDQQKFESGSVWGCKGCASYIGVYFLDYKSTKVPGAMEFVKTSNLNSK